MKENNTVAVDSKKTARSAKKSFSMSYRRVTPIIIFIVLLALHFVANAMVSQVSRAEGVIMLADRVIPITSLTGVVSSLGNICIICLAVFYGKVGFYTSLVILLCYFPIHTAGMLNQRVLVGLSGIFVNIFDLITIILIHIFNSKLNNYQKKLRDQAFTDTFTGLPNRFACSEYIGGLIRRREAFTVVSINLNSFKSINNSMGQSTGDEVLLEIASRWRTAEDESLSGTDDFITRQSGDEFILVIRNYNTEEDILETIKCYKSLLEKKITVDNYDIHMTAGFGYAEFPKDAVTVDTLLMYADAAMHEVKYTNNSEHIMRFTPDMLAFERTLEIEHKIRNAIENDTIFFNLQPQFDLSHRLRGFEALARMNDSDGNIISPGEFIPVAEKARLIDKVDACVFRKSAEFFGKLIKKTGTGITLSVNVSVRHLMRNDFVDEVREILNTCGVPADQIEIEITESILIDSADKALHTINEIRSMGIKIAIDDFGTGYSSLSYLHKFPADLLKIDKSFIDDMNTGDSSKQYVAAIISIGHIMNFEVISEGVEAPEQLDTLRSIGCDYIQGYIWGRPMMPEDAEKIVPEYAG